MNKKLTKLMHKLCSARAELKHFIDETEDTKRIVKEIETALDMIPYIEQDIARLEMIATWGKS